MPIYKIADICLSYSPLTELFSEIMKKYECSDDSFDIEFRLEMKDKLNRKNYVSERMLNEDISFCRKFSEILIERFNGVLFHAAAVSVGNRAFLFTAESGVGKTTHISLLKSCFGGSVRIINGDKPILRYTDGKITVYGSPWNGKENYGEDVSAELGAVFFVSRAEKNSCKRVSGADMLHLLMKQTAVPESLDGKLKTLDFLEKLVTGADFFELKCNMNDEAAYTSYKVIKEIIENED